MSDEITTAKDRLTIPALGAMLFPGWRPGKSCRSPFREDRNNSFSVYDYGRRWKDFAKEEKGDAIDFLARARGLSNDDAVNTFIVLAGGDTPTRIETKRHEVRKPVQFPDDMRPGNHAELTLLAKLRNLNIEAAALAGERGLLRFGTMQDGNSAITAWIITDQDRRNGQARRLDGLGWQSLPGTPKAKTLPGSQAAWPVGIGGARSFPYIALVEGGPDLIAALHFAWAEDLESKVTPVAMLGASLTIPDDALPLFKGKRVRIFPHLDDAGQDAAVRWERQLTEAGADVDCFSLGGIRMNDGGPVGDLNDLALLHADDFEDDRALWSLFDCAGVEHE
jgi:hypothetical protein